ncbi:hypothetical protein [Arcticibacterium luteifluviistationis]|nr:hypothetical protein [Arcticibacterium luteifluviistationis]
MKHILFIALILATSSISLFISCNNPDNPEPVVVIDSTTLKPELNFSYEILDSGYVQFYSNTKNVKPTGWQTMWGSVHGLSSISPKYWFPNGDNPIEFRAITKYDVFADTLFSINITNSIPQIDTERFVKGVIFGDIIDTTYNRFIQNSPYNGSLFPDDKFPSAVARPTSISYIEVDDLNEVPD